MTRPRIPTQKECLNPVFKALHKLGGKATNQQIYDFVVQELALTPEQLSVPARKRQSSKLNRVGFNINFAKTGLKNAGFLEQPRPTIWQLTTAGEAEKMIDPSDVMRTNRIFYRERRLQKKKAELDTQELDSAENDESRDTTSEPKHVSIPAGHIESSPTHDQIQWLLLSLGKEMGLDIWVASNDRNKSFEGNAFSGIPRLRSQSSSPI